jgi:hypothetical protein
MKWVTYGFEAVCIPPGKILALLLLSVGFTFGNGFFCGLVDHGTPVPGVFSR